MNNDIHEGCLSGLDIFVGGPIQHAIVPDGFFGRLRTSISTAIGHIEDNGGNVFSAHVVEKFGAETAAFTPDQVSVRDFRWMKKCDVFVPILPVMADVLLRTDGTHVELGWATALGRPIVMIIKQPFVDSASHLLKGLPRVGSVQIIDIDDFDENPHLLTDCLLRATERQREAIGVSVS